MKKSVSADPIRLGVPEKKGGDVSKRDLSRAARISSLEKGGYNRIKRRRMLIRGTAARTVDSGSRVKCANRASCDKYKQVRTT